ncbi:hypothetical protein FC70_GL001571 [Paucilactobacillus oligofermentans DSM 15707 = LMG 22743]|uniref:Heavy metal-binding domain-containing protein n=1 Tax=Paucilactobacillus oligofermentans DSM 15707 = LMG 22743 TaxID=1423778 RepID=A0A0R1RDT9_9LACO|nr:heavy metal-binding domain-containing protein [Paucilactobacillus oligofermentans]KRL54769.1 hypothetical protein FC70_GL001571 [Paucilactobacillus oligofermentans DSM 15707 = LMG 22743]CUS26316.1 Putative heavy-metal-binding protein [Paucilactobacillus oligofermentans DSM 15707 = LMG 22743]
MKLKELARQGNVSVEWLSKFVSESSDYETTSTTFGGIVVDDNDAESILTDFNAKEEIRKQSEMDQKQAAINEADKKNKALAEMLITSGFNFDGYSVVKYSGYISGDDAVQVDRGHQGIFSSTTNVGDALMSNLSFIRRRALVELKEQAYALGCNAIIGVDFDYLTLDPETAGSNGGTLYLPYVFGVTANGNAVVIKNDKEVIVK